MRSTNKLAIENLERREVFTAMPGVEGLVDISDPHMPDLWRGTPGAQDSLIVDQSGFVGFFDGSDVGLSVASPRDAKSGMPTGMRHGVVLGSLDGDFGNAAVDQVFAGRQNVSPDSTVVFNELP